MFRGHGESEIKREKWINNSGDDGRGRRERLFIVILFQCSDAMTVSVKTRQQQKKGGDKSLGEGERMALLLSPERCMLLLRLDPKNFGARTWGVSSCSSCSEWIKASSFLRACSETRHRETWSRLRWRWRWRLRLIILQFCEKDRATGSI